MTRLVSRLVLVLLLGAIINVAVAVSLAAWVTVSREYIPKDVSAAYWMRYAGSTKAHDSRTRYSEHVLGRGVGYRYIVLSAGYSSPDYSPNTWFVVGYHHIVRASMPLLCMETDTPHNHDKDRWKLTAPGRIDLEVVQLGERPLPVRPLWPGFAINTIFYAAILRLPFAALGTLRRRRRIKRGLCPGCGYDLRGSASLTSPECGRQAQIGSNKSGLRLQTILVESSAAPARSCSARLDAESPHLVAEHTQPYRTPLLVPS
jgi:hypothetical protein